MAEAKNLPFHVHFAEDLPPFMDSDPKRLQQILKNLLSNAVKFTAHGHVEVRVGLATQGWSPDHPVLSKAQQVVAFAVEDTGIGIAPEKQRLIFEAFQQADAGTSRKYGGTGLGLAISRELAVLLGGEIKLASVHGQGSTFTLFLPLHYSGPDSARTDASRSAATGSVARELTVLPVAREEHIEDDRNAIEDGDPVLLIIEDDPHYARILLGLARDKGFKGIVATKGAHGPFPRPAVPPHGHLARYFPARHARLDGAQPAQARPGHAPHPGADRHPGRRTPARPRARRLRLPRQGAHHRGPGSGVRPHQGLHRPAHQAAAGRRGQRHRAAVHRRAARL